LYVTIFKYSLCRLV